MFIRVVICLSYLNDNLLIIFFIPKSVVLMRFYTKSLLKVIKLMLLEMGSIMVKRYEW